MRARIPAPIRAVLLVTALGLAAAAGYPGADLVALGSSLRQGESAPPSAAAAPGMPWLHVAHPASGPPYIADAQGRQVILRGTVAAGLIDWWSPCPASSPGLAARGYPDLGIHDRGHLVFLEADHLRSQLDFQTDVPLPVSSYANLVYAIHAYTHKFTIDALLGQPASQATYPWGGFGQSYIDAEREAASMGAALFVTEFGNEPASDATLLASQLRQQEIHHVGATYWPWKENCDFGATWGVDAGVFGESPDQRCAYDHGVSRVADPPQSGCLRQGKEELLARAWPVAIGARSFTYSYDSSSGAFHLAADSAAGPETLVIVPPEVTGAVSVGEAATLRQVEPRPSGGRILHVAPAGGRYTIELAPPPLALTGC
jgi:hypothetical protein